MNTNPNNNKTENTAGAPQSDENVQISIPRNDRPEGPFEHSGETANWTEAEEQEVKQLEKEGEKI